MARIMLTISAVILLSVLVGCQEERQSQAHIAPPEPAANVSSLTFAAVGAGEMDMVEKVAACRQAYKQALEGLVYYYLKSGNNIKYNWAQKELAAVNLGPQYRYVVAAQVAGPELRASAGIPVADALYKEALYYHNSGKGIGIITDDTKLRMALDRFNQLIRKYPASDKIDDAAFKAGEIYEHFEDYEIAALYYQRTFQWDAQTEYPARFRLAFVLDKYLRQRADALAMYRLAQQEEGKRFPTYRTFIEQRIGELTKVGPAQR